MAATFPPPLPPASDTVAAPPALPRTTEHEIVLVGSGLAHLLIVKWWGRRPLANARLTLVSAFDKAAYAPMLPGVLAGQYDRDDFQIDLEQLCRKCGVRLVVDRVIRLSPRERNVGLSHLPDILFDVASINLGSVPAGEALWQGRRAVVAIKPMANFVQRLETRLAELFAQRLTGGAQPILRFSVVGGGAAGVELALCLEQRLHERHWPAEVTLYEAGPTILPGFPPEFRHQVRQLLTKRGITVQTERHIVECEDADGIWLVDSNGEAFATDLAFWAVGARPPAVLSGFDLPKYKNGFLTVDDSLSCCADPPVFAVGDVAEGKSWKVPRSASTSVQMAPLLWTNLRAAVQGNALRSFRPRTNQVQFLNLGDGTAAWSWGRFSGMSRIAWKIKNLADRRFVERLQSSQ